MKKALKRLALAGLALVVVFVAGALLAPRFDAQALREPLQAALREQLGREVAVREVRYALFPTIGLTATDIVIPEDPRFGLEPVAYVTELQAGVHWSSLFRRRIVFSSLRLVEASVNLARSDEHGWNVGVLMSDVAERMRVQRQAPAISLRRGRINFRQGTLKSPFFLNTVDLDLEPPSAPGAPVEWSVEASPARTDRSEQGFGRFRGEGRWRQGGEGAPGIAEVELELERSATSEVAILLAGRDLGLQGRLGARLRLDGPPRAMVLRGRLELEDLDRGGRFGARGEEWVLPIEGDLSLERQTLEIRTLKAQAEEETPLSILLAVEGFWTKPQVEAAFTLNGFPAATFLDLARRLGAETPRGFGIEGTLHGALAVPREGPMNGEVELRDAEVRLESAGPVTIPGATVRMAGGSLELLPAMLATPSGATAELAGRWTAATGALAFQAKSDALPLEELRTALAQLPQEAAPAPLSLCQGGNLGGILKYEQSPEAGAGAWAADVALEGMTCSVPGLARPVVLVKGPLTVRGAQWGIRQAAVRFGQAEAAVTFQTGRGRGVRPLLSIQAQRLRAAQLEEMVRPAPGQRGSLLDRTLRRQQALPEWLTARRLEVELRARHLEVADREYEKLRLHGYWDGPRIDVARVELALAGGAFSGRGEVALGGGSQLYRLVGQMDRWPLDGAVVDATVDLRAGGMGRAVIESLRMAGRLDARRVASSAGTVDWFAACYDFDAARPAAARLRLECIEARDGGEYFTGEPVAVNWEQAVVELEGPRRTLRLGWPPAQ